MVVIVNALFAVDKIDFFHKINRLRGVELAGQTLYPSWTLTGQKSCCSQERRFCTSHPVDIQQVFHRPSRFSAFFVAKRRSLAAKNQDEGVSKLASEFLAKPKFMPSMQVVEQSWLAGLVVSCPKTAWVFGLQDKVCIQG